MRSINRATALASFKSLDGGSFDDELFRIPERPKPGGIGNSLSDVESNGVTRTSLETWEHDRSLIHTVLENGNTEKTSDPELGEDSVRIYLREIGHVALLIGDEEAILARTIELATWLERVEGFCQNSGHNPTRG